MNTNNDAVVAAIVKAAEKNSGKWDYSKLPTVQNASVHIARNRRVNDGASVEASGYIVYVQVGGKWRTANEVLHYYGYKTATAVYTDKAKAEAYIEKIRSTWGVAVPVKEKRPRKASKAEMLLAAISAKTGLSVDELKEMAAAA